MLENESTVDAGQEIVVESQETSEQSEVVETPESVQTEVAPVTEVQTKEENANYAKIRKDAEQHSIDKFISDQYGEEFGIHTKVEYDKAIAEQKQTKLSESLENGEVNADDYYNKRKENDPDFQKYKDDMQANSIKSQLDNLNIELKDLDIDIDIKSIDDIAKLDNVDEITKHIESGKTLSEAYFLANKKNIINKRAERVQTDTLNRVASLEGASPGSLNNPGEEKSQSIYDLSKADFNKMQEDILMRRRK